MEWHKGYGTDGGDHPHFVMQTSDGGYVMTGESSSRSEQRILVVKTDSNGDKQWQQALGGDGEDLGNYICETADGSLILAGAIDKNRALVKLSASGNIVWEKTYPSSGRDAIEGIDLTSDGGIICTGYLNGEEGTSFIIHDGQAFLMKTDAEGNVAWEKDLSPAASQGFKLREVDDGYAISGVSPRGGGNFCLIKTDKSGNIQWHREYGGDEQEDLYDFDVASDGGYVLAGHKLIYGKVSENTDVFDFWLVKVDRNGDLEWDRTFGQPRGYDPRYTRDECYGVRHTPDGGYIMCGGNGDETRSFSASGSPYGPSDIWQVYLVKTDAKGNLLWESCYGSTEAHDAGEYLGLTRDGGYIIAVDADSAGADTYRPNNFGFMKIAPDASAAKAPQPAMEWHKGYGTDRGDHVHYGMQTSDGGYIMTGQTSEGRRASDMLVVKTDAKGDLQWQKLIGESGQADYGTFVTEVADGFIAAGALTSGDSQERALVKFDAKGSIVWQKTYPAAGNGSIRGIDLTADGGIVATGYVGSGQRGYQFISDDGQGSILKTDTGGNVQWEKTLSAAPHGMRVEEVAGGYAIGANVWMQEGGKNQQQVCLILTDSDGDETYHSYYGGDGDDQVFDFAVTSDGGYIFGGHSRSPSYGTVNWDFFLLKVGSDKKEQWHRTFGQPRGYDARYIHDESYGVKQTPDGGYVVTGGTGDEYRYSASGHPFGGSDLWLAYVVRTDGNGNLLWEGLYGDLEGNNAGEYINLTSDGGYVVFTDSDTAGSMGSNNFGLMKIAPDPSAARTPPPAMQWHYGLGTDTEEKCQHVMQTSDGGYLVVGMTDEAAGRASDMLIIKADAEGDEQWQKIIGTPGQHDWANISAEVADGYIVAGALSDSGDQERGIVKLDFDGNMVSGWPKTYHADGVDAIRGIDITGDGSIVATGYVGGAEHGYLFICSSGKGSIMKTDAEGNLQWDKVLPSTMHGMRVQEVAGGFAIGGNQWRDLEGRNQQDVVLVLTDSDGDETFHDYYGGDGDDQVFDFAVTTDGGYIFGGHSRSPSYGSANWDFYLLKVGSDKKEQWHKTFGQPRGYDAKYIHDEAYGVQQTPDGGFIIAGGSGDEFRYSESGHPTGPSDEWKAYLVKTDADGNVQWEGVYPPTSEGNNAAEHINLTSDGGYIVCTDSDTAPGPPPNNFGLMKIAPDTSAGKIPPSAAQ